MNEDSMDGKWARIDERTKLIIDTMSHLTRKVEDIETAIQDMNLSLSTKIDDHEEKDQNTYMTRREGGMVAATLTGLVTVLTIIGYFWK